MESSGLSPSRPVYVNFFAFRRRLFRRAGIKVWMPRGIYRPIASLCPNKRWASTLPRLDHPAVDESTVEVLRPTVCSDIGLRWDGIYRGWTIRQLMYRSQFTLSRLCTIIGVLVSGQ